MTLEAFETKYTGQSNVGDTASNKGQCVGLIEVWLDENGLSSSHIWGNAKDLIVNSNKSVFTVGYTWPAPKGAIVCFDGYYGGGVGHTGISRGDGILFEQNDPDGSTPHVKSYPNAHYLGYLIAPQLVQGGTMNPTPDNAIADADFVKAYCIQVWGPGGDIPGRMAWTGQTVRYVINQGGSDNSALYALVRDGKLIGASQLTDAQNQVKALTNQVNNQIKNLATLTQQLNDANTEIAQLKGQPAPAPIPVPEPVKASAFQRFWCALVGIKL